MIEEVTEEEKFQVRQNLRKRAFTEEEIEEIIRYDLKVQEGLVGKRHIVVELHPTYTRLEQERTRVAVFEKWGREGLSEEECNKKWWELVSSFISDLTFTNVANLSCLPPKVTDYDISEEEVKVAEEKRDKEFQKKKEDYENRTSTEEIVNEAAQIGMFAKEIKELDELKERVTYLEKELGNIINFFDDFLFNLENFQTDMFQRFCKIDRENRFNSLGEENE